MILFLTDGTPSLPHPPVSQQNPEDILAAQSAARQAARQGVRVNVYGIGPGAIREPIAATEIARTTGGIYYPVRRPGDIVSVFSGVTFANVNSVVAVNLTSGEASGPFDIHLKPDGSFEGFVPVVPGKNRLRVAAFSTDGVRGSAEVTIDYRHEELTTSEKRAELERIRERTRAIQLELERRRQDEYRKREPERALDLEIEKSSNQETQP